MIWGCEHGFVTEWARMVPNAIFSLPVKCQFTEFSSVQAMFPKGTHRIPLEYLKELSFTVVLIMSLSIQYL